MSTRGELSTFAHKKGSDGCFLVPKKKGQWFFGRLQHNIGWIVGADDDGTCLLGDGTVRTFSVKDIEAAIGRLRNKIPMHLSDHKKDYEFGKGGKDSLHFHETNIAPEELQVLIAKSQSLYRATVPPKPVRDPPPPKPKPIKSIYPRSQVTRIASPCGPGAEIPQLNEPTMCGWYQGQLKKFSPNESKPYLIRWSCKPAIEMQVTEKVIRRMVMNYKYCDENDIFKGIVGKELLWVCSGFKLRFVKVLAFPTKGTRLYQLAFRDGKTMELTPQDLDRAFVRHDRITNFQPVVTNFTDVGGSEALFRLTHMHAAEKEEGVYPRTSFQRTKSAMYGSDFSSSSQDGDGDMPSYSSQDPQTTAKALVALSKVPLSDELVSISREGESGTKAGLEVECSVMYRAVEERLEDSVMSLSGKETVEETTTTAKVVENTLLPKVVRTNAAENNTTSDDIGKTNTESQVLQLCEPCVFYCMSLFSGGVV